LGFSRTTTSADAKGFAKLFSTVFFFPTSQRTNDGIVCQSGVTSWWQQPKRCEDTLAGVEKPSPVFDVHGVD
jgi:hypothetical protein